MISSCVASNSLSGLWIVNSLNIIHIRFKFANPDPHARGAHRGRYAVYAAGNGRGYSQGHTLPVMLVSEFFFLAENSHFTI